jgi:phage gpG-like protein
MKDLIKQLKKTIHESEAKFELISEAQWSEKPSASKWSKKEILGHLIDSASNNLRRFIVTQYQQNDRIVYHQDEWVAYQDYQGMNTKDIVVLWKALNLQIARVVERIPSEKLQNTCNAGKNDVQLYSIQFFFEDYLPHLDHHLNQIFEK